MIVLGGKCFIYSFCVGFIGAVVFLYFIEHRGKRFKRAPAKSTSTKHLRPKVRGDCKMVLVIRKDLKSTKREIISNCVQACLQAYKQGVQKYPRIVKQWLRNGSTKVAVKVNDEAELILIKKKADEQDMINHMVHLENPAQNLALVLAVGPDVLEQINSVTGHLKLY